MIITARNPFQITGNTPVDSWYSEVKKHDFTGEPRTTGTGHFTQVSYQTRFGPKKDIGRTYGQILPQI